MNNASKNKYVSASKDMKGLYEQGKNVVKKEKGMKKKSKKGRSVKNARKHKISKKTVAMVAI